MFDPDGFLRNVHSGANDICRDRTGPGVRVAQPHSCCQSPKSDTSQSDLDTGQDFHFAEFIHRMLAKYSMTMHGDYIGT